MFKKIRERGLRIKLFNALIVLITIVMGILLIASTVLLDTQYSDFVKAEMNYNKSVSNANMLQAGSDNLTKQVQYFAQTADIIYMTAYFDEVRSQRREQALAGLDVTSQEEAIINRAKRESDELMIMEYRIMKLVTQSLEMQPEIIPDVVREYSLNRDELSLTSGEMLEMAQSLAFGNEYRAMKASIDKNIEDFTNRILERELNNLEYYSGKVETHILVQQVLLVLLIIMILVASILFYTQLIKVLQLQVNHILSDEPLEIHGVYEIRYLSKIYNRMREKNRMTEKALEKRANVDTLTGLLNRGAFEEFVIDRLKEDSDGAFVMLDVDKFKNINDQYGHDVGDRILTKLAELLSSSFRSGDVSGRLGGDEFGIWLARVSEDSLVYVQNRIDEINIDLVSQNEELPTVSVSAGIAVRGVEDDYQSLYKRADTALYLAKDKKRKARAQSY